MTTPAPEQVTLYEQLFSFLNRKYVQRADDRQRAMGLQYMEAETHDLARELAALRALSQAGERGNKAGTAQAGFKAPSSGSLPNTSGPVTPATPPVPSKKPLSQILAEARASETYKAEAAALEAAAPSAPGTPPPDTPLQIVNRQAEDEGLWFIAQTAPEAYLQRALRELHAAIERPATQDGEITALSKALECYATHENVPGVAAALGRAATLLRDFAPAPEVPDTPLEGTPHYTQMGSAMIETFDGFGKRSGDWVRARDYATISADLAAAPTRGANFTKAVAWMYDRGTEKHLSLHRWPIAGDAKEIALTYLGAAGDPPKRADGCRHTVQRMMEWIDEGACPICAVAAAGMRRDKLHQTALVLQEVLNYGEQGLMIDEHLRNRIEQCLP